MSSIVDSNQSVSSPAGPSNAAMKAKQFRERKKHEEDNRRREIEKLEFKKSNLERTLHDLIENNKCLREHSLFFERINNTSRINEIIEKNRLDAKVVEIKISPQIKHIIQQANIANFSNVRNINLQDLTLSNFDENAEPIRSEGANYTNYMDENVQPITSEEVNYTNYIDENVQPMTSEEVNYTNYKFATINNPNEPTPFLTQLNQQYPSHFIPNQPNPATNIYAFNTQPTPLMMNQPNMMTQTANMSNQPITMSHSNIMTQPSMSHSNIMTQPSMSHNDMMTHASMINVGEQQAPSYSAETMSVNAAPEKNSSLDAIEPSIVDIDTTVVIDNCECHDFDSLELGESMEQYIESDPIESFSRTAYNFIQ